MTWQLLPLLALCALAFSLPAGDTPADAAEGENRFRSTPFYCSFDEVVGADICAGEATPSTRFNHATEKGQFVIEKGFDPKVFKIAKDKGISGGALEVVDVLPRNGRIFFPVKGNLPVKSGGWSGSVSVWCKTDPDRMLKTKFCDPIQITEKTLDRLGRLLKLAEETGLYLDLTGLGCYHKADVPAWYDKLSERERWDAQAAFWTAVAGRCKDSPAVFCYDLMNEPVVPGGRRKDGDWLGPAFGDKHFVQFVTLDQGDRKRPDVAAAWVKHLTAAVRKADRKHLVTVGLVDWSLDRKGLTSGFVPDKVAAELDFVAVHIYPEAGKADDALATLKGFNVGKPVVVEETFPLKCSAKELEEFIDKAAKDKLAAGWVSFYWGKSPDELRQSKTLGDASLLDWLERFSKRKPSS